MLLQRLVEYARTRPDLVPPYFARKPVRYELPITASGKPQSDLIDYQDREDKDRRFGVKRLIPSITRTVGVAPAIGTDNVEYVLGWVSEDKYAARVPKQLDAFQVLNQEWAVADPSGPAAAIGAFYRDGHHLKVDKPADWTRGDLVAFRVEGEFAAETPSALSFWATVAGDRKGSGHEGRCLVCGQVGPLLKTIPQQIPRALLPGATQSASLVSVNEAVHGYELQKFLGHTPICETCGLAFMFGLTSLLSDTDHHRSYSGQDARVAWWIRGDVDVDVMSVLERPTKEQVAELLDSLKSGREAESPDPGFFFSLTVSGSVARVVVRDWIEMPLAQLGIRIKNWFDDTAIVRGHTDEIIHTGLIGLVYAVGRWEKGRGRQNGSWTRLGAKGEDRPQGLHRALVRAALLGERLPPSVSSHVIRRIIADGRVDAARVALIRLSVRRRESNDREAFPVMLDTSNDHPGYVSGRIFAILDDLQSAFAHVSGQRLSTTYFDRYFSRAITNPRIAIRAGESDAKGWLKRIRRERPGWAHAYEVRLDDVMDLVRSREGGIPASATIEAQEQFILGFHQQRAALRRDRAKPGETADLPAIPDDESTSDEGETV